MSATQQIPTTNERDEIAKHAQALFHAGVLAFPASATAKHPNRVKHWAAEYYPPNGLPTREQHTVMFRQPDALRMFVVCGARSGGAICMDFDQTGLFEQWAALISDNMFSRLYIEQSQRSGRFHVVAKVTENMASCVPARDPRKADGTDGDVRIEVRGEGNGFIAAPSVGYQWIQGDLASLTVLAPDQYQTLLGAAAAFNECEPKPEAEPKKRTVRAPADAELPGTIYNRLNGQTEVLDLFQKHGWEIGRRGNGNVSVRHPGATSETSGNVDADGVTNIFSTNTPFEASATGVNNANKPFGVYAILEHGGDFSAAGKALYRLYEPKRKSKATNGAHPAADATEPTVTHPSQVDPETAEILEGRALTDYGNAERLVQYHGEDLRFCHPFGKWLAWDGRRWQIDNTAEVMRRAKQTARRVYQEAADASDPAQAKELAKHAIRSEGDARLRAMIGLAESEPGVPALPEQLDADPWLFNVKNGTIDLKTGTLRPHDRGALITKIAPVTYDPTATCPAFDAFLARILPSENLRRFVQRSIGHSLSGDTREDVIFINFGGGNNGKTTLMQTMQALLGDYAMQTPTETLMVKRGEGVPNDVAALKGARLVAAAEAEEGKRLAESLIKQLTGGDRISARFMRAEWFSFEPTFKIWLSTNHKPIIRGTDKGIWRRVRLIPFAVTIPDTERDAALPEKLHTELPGILNWGLAGCRDWVRNGLGMPEEVKQATASYREEMDILGSWIRDCCITQVEIKASAKSLYISYKQWGESTNERVLPQRTFGMQLTERGFENKRTATGYWWHGIGLRTPMDNEPMNERMNEDEQSSGIPPHEEDSNGFMPNIGSSSFIRSSGRSSDSTDEREEFEV